MNQMKHSPGPWHIEVDPTYLSIAVVKDVTGKEIEGMFSVNRESEMATARLIAAAPELLQFAMYITTATHGVPGLEGYAHLMISRALGGPIEPGPERDVFVRDAVKKYFWPTHQA